MAAIKENGFKIGKLMLKNAVSFLFTLSFIFMFQICFGASNILPGVAISVGLTMIPFCDLKIKPLTMVFIIISLYVGSGVVSQLALSSPFIALPFNFLFVILILLLSCEPMVFNSSISFLLCFVFCQATPVPMEEFPLRFLSTLAGSLIVSAVTVAVWYKRGTAGKGRNLRQQMGLCKKNRGYILRMAIGLSTAMFIGMLFQLKKPLWISIVVMSLTQMELKDTVERIKHRSAATFVGTILFMILFYILIPSEAFYILILLLGYVSFFTPEYKHKQVVNAICAINASLVILNTTDAIINRFLCLMGGIVIVIAMWAIQHCIKKLCACFSEYSATVE